MSFKQQYSSGDPHNIPQVIHSTHLISAASTGYCLCHGVRVHMLSVSV